MNCNICKWPLKEEYIKYKDTAGNPYCYMCYMRLLNG